MTTRILLCAGLSLFLGLVSCRASAERRDTNARELLDRAEVRLGAGDPAAALEDLADVHAIDGLQTDLRAREEALVDRAARARFQELEEGSPDDFEDVFDLGLPARVRARAGILAAEKHLDEGSRVRAFKMVKKVDSKIPGHTERVQAGDLVARAGLSMIQDDSRYGFLWMLRYRSRGIEALEYLVVQYPLDPHCAEAYFRLSEAYEQRDDLDLAIERTQDLLLYHADSAYAVGASARLPYLRLSRLKRDDYDRAELLRAQAEFGAWLARYPEHELCEWVEGLLAECRKRLARSDLYLARYYETIGNALGLRLHAERALGEAQGGGDQALAAEAGALLASADSARLERSDEAVPVPPPLPRPDRSQEVR